MAQATLVAVALHCGSASGTDATDAQVAVLTSGSLAQKIALLNAIEVCGALPPAYQAPIKAIALDATQPDAVRILAGVALCEVRDAYASVLPLLARGSSEKTIAPSARSATLTVIERIVRRAIEQKATDLLPALQAAKERVVASRTAAGVDGAEAASAAEKIDEAIRYLQSVADAKFETFVVKLIGEHRVVFGVGGLYLVLLIAQIVLYVGNARRIVLLDDALQKLSFKLPDWAGGASISLRYLLCTNLLVRSGRVLDRWVAANLATACRNFERAALARHAAAPASLTIDGQALGATPASIRGLLESRICRFMVLGPLEPRVGLLDQVARWCLAGQLSAKVAFPLWLDRNLLASCAGSGELLGKAQSLFRIQNETYVGANFFALLLAKRRIVVIVPDLAKEDIRPMVELMMTAFPTGACLFLGVDKASHELLISFATIEVEAASPSPRRRGRPPKAGVAQPSA